MGREHEWVVIDSWELNGWGARRLLYPTWVQPVASLEDYCPQCGKRGAYHGTIDLVPQEPRKRDGWRTIYKPQRNRSADDVLAIQSRRR